jgi:hypothetical protein
MDSRTVVRAVALARIGLGAALIAAPVRFTAPWLGGDARRSGTRVATRGLGARDVALGAGTLACRDGDLPRWVAAAVLADATDLAATVSAGDALPRTGRILVGALAGAGTALGLAALAALGRPAA